MQFRPPASRFSVEGSENEAAAITNQDLSYFFGIINLVAAYDASGIPASSPFKAHRVEFAGEAPGDIGHLPPCCQRRGQARKEKEEEKEGEEGNIRG